MKLRARLLAAFAVVLTVAAGVSLLVTPIPLRDRLLALRDDCLTPKEALDIDLAL